MTMVQILPNVWWGPYPAQQDPDPRERWEPLIEGVVEVLQELEPEIQATIEDAEGVGYNTRGEAYITTEYRYVVHGCVLESPVHFVLFVAGMEEEDVDSIEDELAYTRALSARGEDNELYAFCPKVVAHPGYLPGNGKVLVLTVEKGGEG